jgi:hypothetical protein
MHGAQADFPYLVKIFPASERLDELLYKLKLGMGLRLMFWLFG